MAKATWALVAASTALAGCDAPPAKSAREAELEVRVSQLESELAAQRAPKQQQTTYTLTVTWLMPNQPAQTNQTSFSDLAACDEARQGVLDERARLVEEIESQQRENEERMAAAGMRIVAKNERPPPSVSAFCAKG